MAAAANGTIALDLAAGPTPSELAAVKQALASEEDGLDELPVSVGYADLNGDHRPDLIYRSRNSRFCGSAVSCATGAILATPVGYAVHEIPLVDSGDSIFVLPTMHDGMHDLRSDTSDHTFQWNGREYR